MKLKEEQLPQIKKWILKKAKSLGVDISDDTFAEYTLAVIDNSFNPGQLRKYLASELRPFIGNSSTDFVSELVSSLEGNKFVDGNAQVSNTNGNENEDYFKRLNPKIVKHNKKLKPGKVVKVNKVVKIKEIQNKKMKKKEFKRKSQNASLADPKINYTPRFQLLRLVTERPYPKADTLIVANVPEDKLDEESIWDFFSKFGDLENITIEFELRFARVKFLTESGAKLAWNSPVPIFDNRFIKLYYARPRDLSRLSIEELKRKQEYLAVKYEVKQERRFEFEKRTFSYLDKKEAMMNQHLKLIKALEEKLQEGSDDPCDIQKEIEKYKTNAIKLGYAPEIFLKEKERLLNKIRIIRGEKPAYTKVAEPNVDKLQQKLTLDNRSKDVKVTPVSAEEEKEFIESIIGDKYKIQSSRINDKSIKLTFSNRLEAQNFVATEERFKDKLLVKLFIIRSNKTKSKPPSKKAKEDDVIMID